ncbi:MAG: aldo/keto reductase [Chloroflexi bacterium]|nr:aldo/keto reductase [Chloroflexota bacterium]
MPLPDKTTAFLHNTEMGLGAWAWGDRLYWDYGRGYTDQDIEAGFRAALEAGINLVDTAEIYGSGRSERLLGQFLKTTQTPVRVATKYFPFPWRFGRPALLRALRHSLERTGLERVDLYQIHWPPVVGTVEGLAEALADAVQAGLARAVGVSNYDRNQVQRAYTILARRNVPLASNQVEYHLLNRQVEKSGLLARCQELGVRVIAYSPLAKGLLTGKYSTHNPPPSLRGRLFASILPRLQPLIDLLAEIGQAHGGRTPSQVALNWTVCKGTLPIPGAKNAAQAIENLGALGWRLTPEQMQALDEASDRVTGR